MFRDRKVWRQTVLEAKVHRNRLQRLRKRRRRKRYKSFSTSIPDGDDWPASPSCHFIVGLSALGNQMSRRPGGHQRQF